MKKRTLSQILAARRNGAKSRGPKTPEGKRRSSLNAVTHGLTAKTLVLPGESQDRFLQHQQAIDQTLAPRNYVEQIIARRVSAAAWRLLRSDGLESCLVEEQLALTDPGATAARTVATAWADSRADRATIYEMRNQRAFYQALRGFTHVRGQGFNNVQVMQTIETEAGYADEPKGTNEPEPQNPALDCGDRAA